MWRHLLDVMLLGQIIRPELGQPEGQKIQMNRRVFSQKSQKSEVIGVNVICHQVKMCTTVLSENHTIKGFVDESCKGAVLTEYSCTYLQ